MNRRWGTMWIFLLGAACMSLSLALRLHLIGTIGVAFVGITLSDVIRSFEKP